MATVKLGSSDLTAYKVGTTTVTKIYLGNQQVYPAFTPTGGLLPHMIWGSVI